MTMTMRLRGQSCLRIEEIVRRIIPTGSPQQGMMIPTVGSTPYGSGWGSGTARHQWLATLKNVVRSVNKFATKNGHDSHGMSWFRAPNNHGTYRSEARR